MTTYYIDRIFGTMTKDKIIVIPIDTLYCKLRFFCTCEPDMPLPNRARLPDHKSSRRCLRNDFSDRFPGLRPAL